MRRIALIMVAAAALIGAVPASAHLVAHPRCSSLRCRVVSQKQNLKHARFLCHYGRNATRIWGCQATRWLARELHETEAALRPRVQVASHYRGWLCITHGPSFNDTGPHEGNGYSGSYSGPLGMTTPWLGYNPPGSDWVHSPVSAVYAIAEHVASLHGFNYLWMAGQWPNTFPPCAGYF